MISPLPQSASSCRARYSDDLPVPLAPVMTVSCASGSTISRSDRYPRMATVVSTPPG
ncbi:Uncharacterised protein [Mycobacteroides abscessus subsp. abscessus]|nr:Uncharacterised protein [Mycobacteroides abscessus subsp. abscessus]